MFVGEVIDAFVTQGKESLAYHQIKYGAVAFNIPKPSQDERSRIAKIVEKHKKSQA